MKNSLRGGSLAVVFAGLLMLAAPAVSYGATTTFNLNIPSRMGLPRTARLRITLELSGPATGASLAFNNGMETVNTVGVPAGATFANKDDIFVNSPAGKPNHIVILYSPFSRFTETAPNTFNFCLPSALPEDQVIGVTVDGPTIDAYRITSYTLAFVSDPNDPNDQETLECGNAVRRSRLYAANLSNFSSGPPTDKGRHPLDVILVLDNSGSMSSPPPPSPGQILNESKWTYLKNGVAQFIAIWAQSNLANTGGTDLADDRIGLVFFSTIAEAANFAAMGNPATIFKARGINPASDWDAVNTKINAKGPTNSTAMGLGLQLGIDSWAPVPGVKNDATIVLMTDGIQNVAPLVTKEAGTGITQLDPPGAPPVKQLYTYGLPILTVAFGSLSPGTAYTQLLNDISVQTAGASIITATPTGMEQSFGTQLVNALKGNTLSINTRAEGVLSLSGSASATHTALLDGSVKRAIVVLGWPSGSGKGLDLQFIPPGSTTPVAPVIRRDATTWTTQSIDIPQSGGIGDWTIKVVNKSSGFTGAAIAQPSSIPYHLSVYTVEGRLDYHISLSSLRNGTGDSLVVKAEVSYDGKPLENVAEGIKLVIERPNEGLGTILHNSTDVPGSVLNSPGNSPDVTTPYDRKLQHLVDKGGLLGQVTPQPLPNAFVMRDDGNVANGDNKAGDAVYSALLTDTSRPGLYRFKVTLDWNDPRTGKIHRIETLEREVKVKPDATASEVAVETKQGTHLITVTPRDKFKNYMGPGYPTLISVQSSAGNIGTTDDAQVTGNYLVPLTGVPPGTDPQIKIIVDGITIRDKKLSELGGTTQTPGGGNTIPADAGDKRWGLSLHAGANFPHSDFNDFFNSGFSFNADLEYRLSNHVSLEALYGYHRFPTEFFSEHLDVHQFSGNVKVFGGGSSVRPFINGGGGAYRFGGLGGSDTRGGANIGGGLQFNLTPTFAIEGAYNFHTVFTPGANLKFSTLQGGVRFRF